MKTPEIQFTDYESNTVQNSNIENTINKTKITVDLAEIFWLNQKEINKITENETVKLSDKMEVNKTEAQLAQMFGKYNELMNLNIKSINNQEFKPVTSYEFAA